jgi:hypothetical protein
MGKKDEQRARDFAEAKGIITFAVEVDPCIWYEAEERRLEHKRFPRLPLTLEQSFIQLACRQRGRFAIDHLKAEYRKITKAEGRYEIRVIPEEERILQRLVWPLRDAKVAFMVGNYLGTIAMAGVLAETVTMLHYELQAPDLNPAKVTAAFEVERESRSFEDADQANRVAILKRLKLLTRSQVQWLGQIRSIRRRQLHLLSQTLPTEQEAIHCYVCALKLVSTTTRKPGSRRGMAVHDKLFRLLKEKGRTMTWKPNPETGRMEPTNE